MALPEARGLEFGPGDNPTPLPEGVRVATVDHALDAGAGLPGAAPIDHAWAGSGALASGAYVACHCWVFTPESVLALVGDATRLGLFPFVLNRIGATEVGGFEFYVSMRRDAEEEPGALRRLQEGAIDHLDRVLAQQRRTAALLAGR